MTDARLVTEDRDTLARGLHALVCGLGCAGGVDDFVNADALIASGVVTTAAAYPHRKDRAVSESADHSLSHVMCPSMRKCPCSAIMLVEADRQGAARVTAVVEALAQDWRGGTGHVSVLDLKRALGSVAPPWTSAR